LWVSVGNDITNFEQPAPLQSEEGGEGHSVAVSENAVGYEAPAVLADNDERSGLRFGKFDRLRGAEVEPAKGGVNEVVGFHKSSLDEAENEKPRTFSMLASSVRFYIATVRRLGNSVGQPLFHRGQGRCFSLGWSWVCAECFNRSGDLHQLVYHLISPYDLIILNRLAEVKP
jgi:hypothetical protein